MILYAYYMFQSLIIIRKRNYYFSGGRMTISNDKYYLQHLHPGDSQDIMDTTKISGLLKKVTV